MFVARVQFVEWFRKAVCNTAGPTKQARSNFDKHRFAPAADLHGDVREEWGRGGGEQSGQLTGSE